jgi:heme exporter protein C
VHEQVAGSAGGTSTRGTRTLGALAALGVAWLLAFALLFSPADRDQSDSVRILYAHVPSAWLAYLAFIVTAIASALYLFRSAHSLAWDRLAGASAEIGVLFMGITLVTGMLWGRLTWGVFWTWDARLTSTAFLFVTYLGYLAVRRLGGTHHQRARRSAIVAMLAVIEIPLVHFSVTLWRSLHQEASVANPEGDVKMDGLMLFSLFVGLIAFTLLYVWLVIHRQRALTLEDLVEDDSLDEALRARRAEAVVGGH